MSPEISELHEALVVYEPPPRRVGLGAEAPLVSPANPYPTSGYTITVPSTVTVQAAALMTLGGLLLGLILANSWART